jgi:hypothetical protein
MEMDNKRQLFRLIEKFAAEENPSELIDSITHCVHSVTTKSKGRKVSEEKEKLEFRIEVLEGSIKRTESRINKSEGDLEKNIKSIRARLESRIEDLRKKTEIEVKRLSSELLHLKEEKNYAEKQLLDCLSGNVKTNGVLPSSFRFTPPPPAHNQEEEDISYDDIDKLIGDSSGSFIPGDHPSTGGKRPRTSAYQGELTTSAGKHPVVAVTKKRKKKEDKKARGIIFDGFMTSSSSESVSGDSTTYSSTKTTSSCSSPLTPTDSEEAEKYERFLLGDDYVSPRRRMSYQEEDILAMVTPHIERAKEENNNRGRAKKVPKRGGAPSNKSKKKSSSTNRVVQPSQTTPGHPAPFVVPSLSLNSNEKKLSAEGMADYGSWRSLPAYIPMEIVVGGMRRCQFCNKDVTTYECKCKCWRGHTRQECCYGGAGAEDPGGSHASHDGGFYKTEHMAIALHNIRDVEAPDMLFKKCNWKVLRDQLRDTFDGMGDELGKMMTDLMKDGYEKKKKVGPCPLCKFKNPFSNVAFGICGDCMAGRSIKEGWKKWKIDAGIQGRAKKPKKKKKPHGKEEEEEVEYISVKKTTKEL